MYHTFFGKFFLPAAFRMGFGGSGMCASLLVCHYRVSVQTHCLVGKKL